MQVKTNAAERYSVKPHMALLSPGEAKIMQRAYGCKARRRAYCDLVLRLSAVPKSVLRCPPNPQCL